MKTAAQVLRDAKRLVDHPAKWCKGGSKREAVHGWPTAYCMLGAIWEAGANFGFSKERNFLNRIVIDVACFNDDKKTTHSHVMYAFDRAIALAEADELPKLQRESDADYTRRVINEITEGGKHAQVA